MLSIAIHETDIDPKKAGLTVVGRCEYRGRHFLLARHTSIAGYLYTFCQLVEGFGGRIMYDEGTAIWSGCNLKLKFKPQDPNISYIFDNYIRQMPGSVF